LIKQRLEPFKLMASFESRSEQQAESQADQSVSPPVSPPAPPPAFRQVVKGAYVINTDAIASPDQVGADGVGDVLIENGVITAIAPLLTNLPADVEMIDGRGQFLGPGLIDLYSQSGQPGYESRETYESLSRAAAAGGFTRVGLLPNTQPAVDNVGAIAAIQNANASRFSAKESVRESTGESARNSHRQAQLIPWATITLGAQGKQLAELAELAEAGALGFTDGAPLVNSALLRRLLEYAQPLQKPIALWPCDPHLVADGVAREGVQSLRLGLPGVSAIAETTVLATLLECVAEIPALVHIMRISTARGVALLRQAKAQELPISASVPWHHLIFDTQDLDGYDPSLRHDPPLGNADDRLALIAGVADGVIDAIAIDHSPYTYEEKTVAFNAAPPGAIGLELALPVLWQAFVDSEQQWSPTQLWQALSEGPAQCLGITPARLKVGELAELTLFDPKVRWQVVPTALHSLASNTPWANQTLQGKVTATWIPQK
jgi:dihydroorotase